VVAPTEKEYRESLVQGALTGQRLQIMTFLVDGRECAFEVADALEVIKPRLVTKVPRTPDYVLGILSVRGEMVPIIDLRRRLGAAPAEDVPLSRVLVLSQSDIRVGFLVDRMTGVEEAEKRSVMPPDWGGEARGFPVEFIKGLIVLKGRNITLLNITNLLDFAPSEAVPGD